MTLDRQRGLPEGMPKEAVTGFLARTLRSIPRSDQRHWAEVYVRGLLSAEGKKTVRALASSAGGGVEQSLYQFISKSPWDSEPVRRELASTLYEAAGPRAWVVQPLDVAKAGEHSVGVQRQFVPEAGRVVNCQRSIGIWLASDELSCPVDWRLSLPEPWIQDSSSRQRASIPDGVGACPPEQCAIGSISAIAERWGLPGRPVVMDLGDTDPYPVCGQLAALRIPFIARVKPCRPSTALHARLTPVGAEADDGPGELVGALSRRCVPVEWMDHLTGRVRATPVGAVRVRLRGGDRGDRPELVLIGAWNSPGGRLPSEYWLSNLSQSRLGVVYRTAMLGRRVQRDLSEVGDGLGLRDFEGRSFRGWHHHMTMVSLAHALTVLASGPWSAGEATDKEATDKPVRLAPPRSPRAAA